MPICPRCGKSLSSEQALQYHLNRKFKCGTWKCLKCSSSFDTKFDLNIHEMNCVDGRVDCPSYDVLRVFYKNMRSVMFELDSIGTIKNVSPNVKGAYNIDADQLIGKKYGDTIDDDQTTARNSVNFFSQCIRENKCNIVIEYLV